MLVQIFVVNYSDFTNVNLVLRPLLQPDFRKMFTYIYIYQSNLGHENK